MMEEHQRLINNADDGSLGESEETVYEDAIKQTGYGKFHWLVLILCGWAVSSDAIEVLSVSFMLPSAEKDLKMSSEDKGWLNAIIFVGMMIGGYFWGSLADHHGRRTILLGSLTVNGLGGLVSSTSQVFWLFLLARFISGIGVGGSIPVIFSYFTEFQPKDKRGRMISALATFWMFGNIIAAGLAWSVIPLDIGYTSPSFKYNSWRIFVALCTIPSLSSAVFFIFMPESPKFLLTVGQDKKALAILKLIHKKNNPISSTYRVTTVVLDRDYKPVHNSSHSTGCTAGMSKNLQNLMSTSKELFKPPLLRLSIIMIIINFSLSFGYYGLWMWFPELFSRVEKYGGSPCDHHVTVPNKTTNTTDFLGSEWIYFSGFMTAVSNLPGNLLTIFLMDQLGRKLLLATSMVSSGVSVFFIPLVRNKWENLGISCLFGAVSTIGWNSLDVLSTELFPTNVRSTAMGIQTGVGRLAAIFGNVIFGELVDVHCSIPMIIVSGLLVFGGLCSIRLPSTVRVDIH
ncbi:synaptic vesicle glycoprotein 2C-like [Saccostrea echinata]|uniref:synaptic vesicle glycoprotein 2C-like n=1 Tax=Saccostrea echinata TaxID=191078 RepID=UPI002A7F1F76|nr:synaptic vesicle glycoprotein 2C-like [Saccostrea echinata]XP_061193562.1 synaptic vesicle glycoprotein 2C-like [Saccostrea echinata]